MPTEAELIEAAVAPRVTLDQLENTIVSEWYFTAADGVTGSLENGDGSMPDGDDTFTWTALGLLTFCVLVLKNGFTIMGQAACADPANFNAGIGRELARKDAVGKVWPLLGYELKTKLTEKNHD